MNSLFLVLLLAPLLLNALNIDDSFESFKAQYNKVYATPAEHAFRLSVYKNNVAFIEEHNRKNLGFTVAMNEFGDLNSEEFGTLYLANTFNADDVARQADVFEHDGEAMAATVDWRTKGAVTGVKNQGQCGSCWSFSTTGSTEGQHQLATGKLVSLSEQNLMDCSTSYGNYGCNGGLMDNAFKYIIANKGIDTEASYPYEASDGSCRYKASNRGASITGFKDVKSKSESSLQSAVQSVGPISVAIDASHSSFQFYSGGVYYEPACSQTQLDHGVLSVGYGTESGQDYWIVKNSWGTSWGSSGYILMSRNRSNNCGIATMASYPTGASE